MWAAPGATGGTVASGSSSEGLKQLNQVVAATVWGGGEKPRVERCGALREAESSGSSPHLGGCASELGAAWSQSAPTAAPTADGLKDRISP